MQIINYNSFAPVKNVTTIRHSYQQHFIFTTALEHIYRTGKRALHYVTTIQSQCERNYTHVPACYFLALTDWWLVAKVTSQHRTISLLAGALAEL